MCSFYTQLDKYMNICLCYIYILQNSRKKLFPVALSFACNRHCTLLLSSQPEQIIAIYYGLLLILNHAAILLSYNDNEITRLLKIFA